MTRQRYTFIDLFAGAGGMALGLRMAGFQPLMAFEYSRQSASTYRRHHRVEVDTRDLSSIAAQEVKAKLMARHGRLPDLITASPPCETFSRAQTKDVSRDQRNYLFRKVLEFTKVLNPPYVLVENVTGFRELNGGVYFNELVTRLEKLGYEVAERVLNAAEYGVPQDRERLFVLARRRDPQLDPQRSPLHLPVPTHQALLHERPGGVRFQMSLTLEPGLTRVRRPAVTVRDALSDLPPLLQPGRWEKDYSRARPPAKRYQKLMRSTLLARLLGSRWHGNRLYNHRAMFHRPETRRRYSYIPPGKGVADVYDQLPADCRPSQAYKIRDRRPRADLPSHTVTAHCVIEILHYDYEGGQHRAITPREAARLQSFPDWYRFVGRRTRRYGASQVQDPYEQIGDAVPPLLARAIGKRIRRYLLEDARLRANLPGR